LGFDLTIYRGLARRSGDADQVWRLLAFALILDVCSQSGAARIAGVALQIMRDWVLRFNEDAPAVWRRRARLRGGLQS